MMGCKNSIPIQTQSEKPLWQFQVLSKHPEKDFERLLFMLGNYIDDYANYLMGRYTPVKKERREKKLFAYELYTKKFISLPQYHMLLSAIDFGKDIRVYQSCDRGISGIKFRYRVKIDGELYLNFRTHFNGFSCFQ